jgi:hypothetical protein
MKTKALSVLAIMVVTILPSCSMFEEDLPKPNPAKNSFSCLINGELYSPEHRFAKLPDDKDEYEILGGTRLDDLSISDGIAIHLPDTVSEGTYTLAGVTGANKTITYMARRTVGTAGESSNEGNITITKLGDGRMAGTFNFKTNRGNVVTEGQFDLELLKY